MKFLQSSASLKKAMICAAVLSVTCVALQANAADDAADFPSRQITLINPFAAGGPTDLIARVVAKHLVMCWASPWLSKTVPAPVGVLDLTPWRMRRPTATRWRRSTFRW